MLAIFSKTFSELTAPDQLEIRGLGDVPLSSSGLSGLWSVIDYRFENLLPTTTYTDLSPLELCKAICNEPKCELLARAIIARLWEMGVARVQQAG